MHKKIIGQRDGLPDQRREAWKMNKTDTTITEAARELRRAYKREWNRRNADRVKAAQRRYWERKAAAKNALTQQTDEPAAAAQEA